jgi:glycine/D-amino acid oxidase-like deaminating enzyme
MNQPAVLVIGAGIVGAAAARHLQRGGARVTVIDAETRGGRATRASWAWINATIGNPEPYFRLRVHAMAAWRTWEAEVPGLAVDWCGGLFSDAAPDALTAFVDGHRAWGYDIRLVDRDEAARLEPQMVEPPAVAAHAPGEGAVDAVACAEALLADAEAAGATVVERTPARRLIVAGGRVTGVETDGGPLAADHVVLAAGTAVPDLAASAGVTIPVTASPGLHVRTEPTRRRLNGLVMTPGLHVRQLACGRLLAGFDFGGTHVDGDPEPVALRDFNTLRARLRDGGDLVMEGFSVGLRPIPADGFPVVGAAPGLAGLTVAVTHSGVTLAPALGAMVAEEVLSGRRHPLLAPFGPERCAA